MHYSYINMYDIDIALSWEVIELSAVQFKFGLKSYAWFRNRTSAQREFDLKSQVLSSFSCNVIGCFVLLSHSHRMKKKKRCDS